MKHIINVKELRASLPKIIHQIRQGDQFTVLYRSRPAFRIVPVDSEGEIKIPLEEDPLYRAPAVGNSGDGFSAREHDKILYGEHL